MDAFLGEIRLFPYTYNPDGWLPCFGQAVSIQIYNALYAVIGDAYGPVTSSSFTLPNFQGSVPVGFGQGPGLSPYELGTSEGASSVVLNLNDIPPHSHSLVAQVPSTPASLVAVPTATTSLSFARKLQTGTTYEKIPINNATLATLGTLPSATVGVNGGAPLPHENQQPFLNMKFFICVKGVWPTRQ